MIAEVETDVVAAIELHNVTVLISIQINNAFTAYVGGG